MNLLFYRNDGTYVAEVNGLPYHVTQDDDRFLEAEKQAKKLGRDLPAEAKPESPAPTLSDYENAIQSHVDEAARSRQFRDGVTLASYVASTNSQWSSEASAFVAWRDAVWGHAYAEFDKVQSGDRGTPTIEEFIAELPPVVWP